MQLPGSVLLLLVALGSGGLGVSARAAGVPPTNSADHCGRCHRAIQDAWKESSHASAMQSRLFQDSLELADREFGSEGRRTCVSCHAPMAQLSGDLALARKVTWEGVTCDYCHSIRDVALTGPNPRAIMDPTGVKWGPLKDSVSVGHPTQYSAAHSASSLCAPCHEYRNAQGFPVLTTFQEWKASRYAKEGRQCQSCHMSRVAGLVVDPKIKRTTAAQVNLHAMPGSHSLKQLTTAVKAQLNASRAGGNIQVSVNLTNQAAGHSFPTGSPLRQLVLEVRAGGQFREERVYARKVADAAGKPIDREHLAFLKAAKVLSDTRLAPGETRTENFSFAIPPGGDVDVVATFIYYYSPMARDESQQRITFLKMNRTVR